MNDGLRLVDPSAYARHGYPHEEWRRLRREPLTYFHAEGWQSFWAVVKHADVIEISKQPERFLNGPGMTIIRKRDEENQGSFMQMRTIINMDQPAHRKYRKVASPWFTPRALRRLDPLVKATARQLVDSLGREGECDFIQTIASIHPLKVIARILGVPEEDEPFILRITNELFGSEDPEFQRSEDFLEHIVIRLWGSSRPNLPERFVVVEGNRRMEHLRVKSFNLTFSSLFAKFPL